MIAAFHAGQFRAGRMARRLARIRSGCLEKDLPGAV